MLVFFILYLLQWGWFIQHMDELGRPGGDNYNGNNLYHQDPLGLWDNNSLFEFLVALGLFVIGILGSSISMWVGQCCAYRGCHCCCPPEDMGEARLPKILFNITGYLAMAMFAFMQCCGVLISLRGSGALYI